MKTCDCCGNEFQYDEVTARTLGDYHTVNLPKLKVRVSLTVTATHPVSGEHADICPDCRILAIAEVVNGRFS